MRRRWPHLLAILVGGAALLTLLHACTNTVPAAGLELVIDSNLTGAQFDSISLTVQQQDTTGGWGAPLVNGPFLVPGEAKLPASFAIAAGTSSDQQVLIQLVALKNGNVVVTREVQISVPTTRVAELTLLLVQACLDQTCTLPNQSCQPDTGVCGPNLIPAAMLPTFRAEAGIASYVDAAGSTDGGAKRDSGASGSGSGSGGSSGSGSGSHSGSGSGGESGSGSGSDSGSGSGSHSGSGSGSSDGGLLQIDGGQQLPDAGHDGGHDSGVDAAHDSGQDPDTGSGACGGGNVPCGGWCCPLGKTCGQPKQCCTGAGPTICMGPLDP